MNWQTIGTRKGIRCGYGAKASDVTMYLIHVNNAGEFVAIVHEKVEHGTLKTFITSGDNVEQVKQACEADWVRGERR